MTTLFRWLGAIGLACLFAAAAGLWPRAAFLMGWWAASAFLLITRQLKAFA